MVLLHCRHVYWVCTEGIRKEEFYSSRRCPADGQQGHGKAEPERWDGGTASCPESGSAEPEASSSENRWSAEARGTGRGTAPDAGTSGRYQGDQTQEAPPAAEKARRMPVDTFEDGAIEWGIKREGEGKEPKDSGT